MSIFVEQTLSHYRILAKIGDDATGTLYRAVDVETNRPVALMALAPGVMGDLERRQRIEQDALASSRLQHPNIAQLYEFFQWEGRDFAVVEAPAGESVYDLLDRKRPHRRDLLRFAKQ